MSSLLKYINQKNSASGQKSKPISMLPPESPLVPAIITGRITLRLEGHINTNLIADYLSLITLAFSCDVLSTRTDLTPLIPSLWVGIQSNLLGMTEIHQFGENISEMVITRTNICAFTEGSVIPSKSLTFNTLGTRTWELQGSNNTLLITILTYDLKVTPGAHHLRSSLRSSGHQMFSYPEEKDRKLFKDLLKWQGKGDRTHSQTVEYLLTKHLNHPSTSLTTTIDHHLELPSITPSAPAPPSAPPSYPIDKIPHFI